MYLLSCNNSVDPRLLIHRGALPKIDDQSFIARAVTNSSAVYIRVNIRTLLATRIHVLLVRCHSCYVSTLHCYREQRDVIIYSKCSEVLVIK